MDPRVLRTETVPPGTLKPHPRNYREHPDDQLAHIIASIREYGFYRNVVATEDGTILAGHGVVKAAIKMDLDMVPVTRLDLKPNDPRALKVLTGDNTIAQLAVVDDRALTELLKDISTIDDLLGTGFDEMMLANLAMVTRPETEIRDTDEAAEWLGMPGYEETGKPLQLALSFRSEEDREELSNRLGLNIMRKQNQTWSAWWPSKDRENLMTVKFEEGDRDEVEELCG